ncbi:MULTISPECIES: hypothetical protein [unclassified Colwellia]|uniref:hypothetical protein n=1 Tax=unclassified Colwellia TaxID=196834 RepID=UPI0015F4AA89|nr:MULTISPECIES: hypothetical protein [unclassified Colwellia]MBA6223103.1 hypothetical protein [Colwellia sp. MB3u-45]MBA6267527.1 hypothetical protein [Colwellia sp. MB3u-43]MBA6289830.1 hypothetical protein [Colwellia sp. MB3u-4]MBA6295627.1 hypothetical protein [Colwellia sp. MB02u-9]MBA6320346.1 hypothetical protein [Colwellia sp. MB02u-19]
MRKAIIVSLSFLLTVMPFTIDAEEQKPKKFADVEYMSITYTDFKPGKADRAMEIITDHYFPASKTAGTQVPYIIRLQSGEWDMATAWTLKDGYSSMEWDVSAEGIKWMEAFNKQEGIEKSKELRDEFNSLIQRSNHVIGYHPINIK